MGSGSTMVPDLGREATLIVPHDIAEIAQQTATDLKWSFERALLALLRRGVEAERAAHENLQTKYDALMQARGPEEIEATGNEMIRAILGPDSVA